MELVIAPNGTVRCLYGEEIGLACLGAIRIIRASRVEPDEQGRWQVDLSPVGGPVLGPFERRSQALAAERDWLMAALEAPGLLASTRNGQSDVEENSSTQFAVGRLT